MVDWPRLRKVPWMVGCWGDVEIWSWMVGWEMVVVVVAGDEVG